MNMLPLVEEMVAWAIPAGLSECNYCIRIRQKKPFQNPLTLGLLSRRYNVNQMCSGIGRTQELMRDAGLPEPVF